MWAGYGVIRCGTAGVFPACLVPSIVTPFSTELVRAIP